jgi:hypothetical protein
MGHGRGVVAGGAGTATTGSRNGGASNGSSRDIAPDARAPVTGPARPPATGDQPALAAPPVTVANESTDAGAHPAHGAAAGAGAWSHPASRPAAARPANGAPPGMASDPDWNGVNNGAPR